MPFPSPYPPPNLWKLYSLWKTNLTRSLLPSSQWVEPVQFPLFNRLLWFMSAVVQTAAGESLRIWLAQNASICATVCLHNVVPYGQVWSTHSPREVRGRWLAKGTHTPASLTNTDMLVPLLLHTDILHMHKQTNIYVGIQGHQHSCTRMQIEEVHTLSAWLRKQKLSLCFGRVTFTEVQPVWSSQSHWTVVLLVLMEDVFDSWDHFCSPCLNNMSSRYGWRQIRHIIVGQYSGSNVVLVHGPQVSIFYLIKCNILNKNDMFLN